MNNSIRLLVRSSQRASCTTAAFRTTSCRSIGSIPSILSNTTAPMRSSNVSTLDLKDLKFGGNQSIRWNTGSAANDTLIDMLNREYSEEVENGAGELTPELDTLKQDIEKDWKIVDNTETAMVRMYKNASPNNTKVQISFHCQDLVTSEFPENEEEQEADEEPSDPMKFNVTVTKAGKTVIFTCTSVEAVCKIESICVSNEAVDAIVVEGGSVSNEKYQGPVFNELAEDLQDAFHTYLSETIGVNSDVAAFIVMYGDYKEQNQYIDFLSATKTILG